MFTIVLNERTILAYPFQILIPNTIVFESYGIANNNQTVPGSGERNINSSLILQKPYIAFEIGSHSRDEDDVPLLALVRIDCADCHLRNSRNPSFLFIQFSNYFREFGFKQTFNVSLLLTIGSDHSNCDLFLARQM